MLFSGTPVHVLVALIPFYGVAIRVLVVICHSCHYSLRKFVNVRIMVSSFVAESLQQVVEISLESLRSLHYIVPYLRCPSNSEFLLLYIHLYRIGLLLQLALVLQLMFELEIGLELGLGPGLLERLDVSPLTH